MENNNSFNYKVFLESFDYDKTEIEKYFHKVIENLENEASFLIGKRDDDVEKLYDEYTKNLELYDKIKYDILSKYFIDYIELNEEYNLKKSKLENETNERINELLDRIENERIVIDQIRSDYLVKFYEAKKEPQKNIDLISKKIDKEYLAHINFITDAKKSIENNKEFYINAEYYLKRADNALEFLDEISEYNEELFNESSIDSNIESNKLTVYLDYINKEIDETLNLSFLNLYDDVKGTFDTIILDSKNRKKEILNESKSLKLNIQKAFKTIDKEIIDTKEFFKNKLKDVSDPSLIKDINKDEKAMLDSLESRKMRISLDYSIEISLLDEEVRIIDSYIDELEKSNHSLGGSFIDEMNKTSSLVLSVLKSIKEFVEDELKAIGSFERDSREARQIVSYFTNRFKNLEIESSVERIKNYKDSIKKTIETNKNLDALAFEILTSEELLKIKLLDLRKILLTLDDELKIKSIEYDNKIEELEHTSTPLIEINNSKTQIELVKNDLKVDLDLLDHELEHKIKLIDLKKNIDILRNDYMIAYTRLENISKIIEKRTGIEPRIVDLTSSIELEKIIENILIDSSNKMKEYTLNIESFNKEIEELDSETSSKLRYLNNVLEIEIKNFENQKMKIVKESEIKKKKIYPLLRDIKSKSGTKLKELKTEYTKYKKEFIISNNKNESVYNELSSSTSTILSNYQDYFNNKELSNELDAYTEYLNNGLSNLYIELNDSLSKYNEYDFVSLTIADDMNFNDIKDYKESKFNILLDKKIKKYLNIVSASINKELDKIIFYKDKELDKKLKKIDDDYKEKIALIAIDNTILETPNLDKLDKIDIEKIEKTKEYEKNISSYKKYYMSTIDSIKTDYESRLNELKNLKDKCEHYTNNLNQEINKEIENEYTKIKDTHSKKIYDVTIGEKALAIKATSSISNMSDEIEKKNGDFEKIKKGYDDINKLYFDGTIEKAKEYYELMKNNMLKYERDVETYIAYKKQDKPNYISSLNKLISEYRINYEDINEFYKEKANIKKADNIFEYTKLLNETRDKDSKDFNEAYNFSKSYEESLEMLSNSLMEKAKSINESLSKDSIESVIKFGDKIDKTTL